MEAKVDWADTNVGTIPKESFEDNMTDGLTPKDFERVDNYRTKYLSTIASDVVSHMEETGQVNATVQMELGGTTSAEIQVQDHHMVVAVTSRLSDTLETITAQCAALASVEPVD